MTFNRNANNTPSQHVALWNGGTRYSVPTWARVATGDKYPGERNGKFRHAIAFENPTHSRSDEAKAPIAMQIRILVPRGRPLPLDLSPHRM